MPSFKARDCRHKEQELSDQHLWQGQAALSVRSKHDECRLPQQLTCGDMARLLASKLTKSPTQGLERASVAIQKPDHARYLLLFVLPSAAKARAGLQPWLCRKLSARDCITP